MLVSIKRIIRWGWQGLFRDGGAATATVFIMVLTISLITSIFLLKEASSFLISSIQEKVDISVYFKENSTEQEILNIQEELSKIPEVQNVKYVSQEQALQDFIQRHKEDPVLMRSLEEVGRNPFLASLNIRASDPTQYEAVSDFLDNSLFGYLIEKVDYHQRKPVIEKIFSLTANLEKSGIVFSVLLVFLSFLVVFNTIRLIIMKGQEEIQIQRLVGASNWFIRGPFLFQGTIFGILSALISLLIFTFVCWFFGSQISILFPELDMWTYFLSNIWTIFLIQLLTGIGLGVVSSLMAIRKYLEI
ncbi:hypothetical protein AMJ50_01295 [Parcubacteria bacterium DG_74_3]|nr:MAG: hypothetical protein AMJ50_01295 [Parcubacteria bacterium DG_74_3]